jgi:hypothetical protein
VILRRFLIYSLSLLPTLAVAAPPSEKVIERYKQLLTAKPAEGTALDRLWQAYSAADVEGAGRRGRETYAGMALVVQGARSYQSLQLRNIRSRRE